MREGKPCPCHPKQAVLPTPKDQNTVHADKRVFLRGGVMHAMEVLHVMQPCECLKSVGVSPESSWNQ